EGARSRGKGHREGEAQRPGGDAGRASSACGGWAAAVTGAASAVGGAGAGESGGAGRARCESIGQRGVDVQSAAARRRGGAGGSESALAGDGSRCGAAGQVMDAVAWARREGAARSDEFESDASECGRFGGRRSTAQGARGG